MQATTSHLQPADAIRLAVWLGLLVGLLDALTCFLLRGRPGTTVRVPDEILWISPAFHVTLLLLVAVGLVVFFRLLTFLGAARWQPSPSAIAGLLAGIASFSWFLRLGKVPQYALAVLCIGIGVQLARMMARRQEGWLRFVRRSLPVLVVLALVLGSGSVLWAGWAESRMVRDLPPAPANGPNVLLITLDTVRADHLSAYGYSRETTPNIDRLAKEGVLFESAFANSSWTLPAHASLLTGRLPREHKGDWRSTVDRDVPTLAEAFYRAGYQTGAFVANNLYLGDEWGLARGFTRYEAHGGALLDDLQRTPLGTKISKTLLPRFGYWDIPGRKRATDVNRRFFHWLDSVQGRPYFAFLNYLDAHDPYVTEDPFQTRFSPHATRGETINFQFQAHAFRRKASPTAEEMHGEIAGYDGCLAYLDEKIGALVAELRRRGTHENTLIVITSDHGEAFGNHNLFGHGNSLYRETLHVPLILIWPGRAPAGARVPHVVGLQDLPRTIQEMVALAGEKFPGESLESLWANGASDAESRHAVSEISQLQEGLPFYPNWSQSLKSVVTNEWHLILSSDGAAELYAWRSDPAESNNLAQTEDGRRVVEELKRMLAAQNQSARREGMHTKP